MIKVIAFDLVGVLVRENDYKLNEIESKIERLFGPNKSDDEFICSVKETISDNTADEIIRISKHVIDSIYDSKVSLKDLVDLKNKHKDILFVVATNHVSFVQECILKKFNNFFNEIYISANLNEIKPNLEFYNKILKDLGISPNEMLFLDDSIKNIQGAKDCDIHTIHVTKEMDIINEIEKLL